MSFTNLLKTQLSNVALQHQSQYVIATSSVGAIIGIALVAWVSHHFVGDTALPFIVASMGAAAVLLYAAPHSPLTQPWAFVGGHLISATIGVSCAQWIPDIFLAAGLAVGLAIFAMHQLNCLHPPGGAAALVAVVGGPQIHTLGYSYVLIPVALNIFILGCSVYVTRLILSHFQTKKEPFIFYSDDQKEANISPIAAFSNDDLAHALHEMDSYIDVSLEDLNRIYIHASILSQKHQLGSKNCNDLMSYRTVAVEFGDYLATAWTLMQQHNTKSLPVINKVRRVIGIITITDFKHEAEKCQGESIEARLKTLIKRTGALSSNKPEVVGQLMTSTVIILSEDTPITEALAIFTTHKIGHIPIINHERRLSGILSRTSVLEHSP